MSDQPRDNPVPDDTEDHGVDHGVEESKTHDPPNTITSTHTTQPAHDDMVLETPRYADSEADSISVDLSSTTVKLLDLLMPCNSVEECALKLASFKLGAAEYVSEYSLRFRTITQPFEFVVERQTHGRTSWAAFSVCLFQHDGLTPSIQCLQLSDQPATSLREAADRARRHEAASLAGGSVSAMPFTPVPNRAAVSQLMNKASTNPQRGFRQPPNSGEGGAAKPGHVSRGNHSGGGSSGGSRGNAGGARAERS